jgi:ribosomal protein S18 acetylase RimI-like enzyme
MIMFRELDEDDSFADLFALSKRFFEEYESYEPEFFAISRFSEESITQYFSKTIRSDSASCLIAVDDSRIVGYVTLSIKTRPEFYQVSAYGCISGLMIDPDYRRQGIATDLLERSKRWLQERDVRFVVLETAQANKRAISFYEKHGFSVLRIQMYSHT